MKTENEENMTTEWIPVYEDDEEVPYIAGYECCKCGYFSRSRYKPTRCTHCNRLYIDPHDEMYE